MFLFWGSGSPPCWRVMLALEEKGLSGYANKLVSFDKGEHKSEEILKWNPRGQVKTAYCFKLFVCFCIVYTFYLAVIAEFFSV